MHEAPTCLDELELIMVHQQTLLLADGFKVIVLDVPRGGGNA
jgi:hypothetical protein